MSPSRLQTNLSCTGQSINTRFHLPQKWRSGSGDAGGSQGFRPLHPASRGCLHITAAGLYNVPRFRRASMGWSLTLLKHHIPTTGASPRRTWGVLTSGIYLGSFWSDLQRKTDGETSPHRLVSWREHDHKE